VRILVTGHDGYIGTVMVGVLKRAGHEVTGLDTFFYEDCRFGDRPVSIPTIRKDLRDVGPGDVTGYDAVIHLAALSNDPLGTLDERCTLEINHRGSVCLARAAKAAGVPRFLFASSCSLYGAAGDDLLDETAAFNPITAYGRSKVLVEQDVSQLADDRFSPTFFRNATAYGVSPRLRADVVVNNLVGVAYLTGTVMIESDGTPWRPLVHVEDVSRAALALLEAPTELVYCEPFNIGADSQNFQVKDVAAIVESIVPDSRVVYAPGGEPDLRSYRVDFSKLTRTFPNAVPQWTLEASVRDLYAAYKRNSLRLEDLLGPRHTRLLRIQELKAAGRLSDDLRWIEAAGR